MYVIRFLSDTFTIIINNFYRWRAGNKEIKYTPRRKSDLLRIIYAIIREQGQNANLNCIDTSLITDMSYIFYKTKFNGDISQWNTKNVTNMVGLFMDSTFNGDISKWNVSQVKNMHDLFSGSTFNGDISNWDVSKVTNMASMFSDSKFNSDISKWNVENVENMRSMFKYSKFKQNIHIWIHPKLDNESYKQISDFKKDLWFLVEQEILNQDILAICGEHGKQIRSLKI